MLAYVFRHQPALTSDFLQYRNRLSSFHAALAAAPPVGFCRSWTWKTQSGPLGAAYEDWYLVERWEGLGALNDAAVAGSRAEPHDEIAARSARGVGAVYRLLSGETSPADRFRLRVTKPRGIGYADFEAALAGTAGPDASIWKRQMVLGPDSEYLINAPRSPLKDTVYDEPVDVSFLQPVA